MSKRQTYFDIGNKLFWALILLILVFAILKLNPNIFKTDYVIREIIVEDSLSKIDWEEKIAETDSLDSRNDSLEIETDLQTSEWNWIDFNNISHSITFSFPKNSYELARENRKNSYDYEPLFLHDKSLLRDLINKMIAEIKKNNLKHLEAIEYVCSSIQYIPYTLILSSDGIEYPVNSGQFVKCPCDLPFGSFTNNCASVTSNGCCNNVDPFGVYSPLEFAVKKTGDCDTRALLAFTILKEMGFDVAVMVSESQSHSVLGIYLPSSVNLSTGTNEFGKKYVLWELTSPDWRLEMPVEGNDWKAALE
jgi:hypothetical protein